MRFSAGLVLVASLFSLPTLLTANEAVHKVPFSLVNGHLITVQGSIHGRVVRLMIDTGSSHTIVNKRAVKKLRLKPRRQTVRVTAWGSTRTTQTVVLRDLRMGPIQATLLCPTMELSSSGVDAIIGLDLLSQRDFTIDYETKTVQFEARLPFESAVEFEARTGSLIIPMRIEGTDIRLMLDTGAPTIVLYGNRTRGLVMVEPSLRQAVGSRFRNVRFGSVRLGPMKWRDVDAMVLKTLVTEESGYDGMFGFHSLEIKRLHFDFGNNTLSWEM